MAVGSSGGLAVVVMLVEEKVCRFYWPSFVDIIIRFLSFFFLFFVCILVQMPLTHYIRYLIKVLLSANEENDCHQTPYHAFFLILK
jgi:hypothetical protein